MMAKVPSFPVQVELQFWPDITAIAATVFLEADGEPTGGQLAVSYVIRNRMNLWGQTCQQVIFGPDGIPDDKYEPFSCWNQDYRTQALARLIRVGSSAEQAWKWAAAGY